MARIGDKFYAYAGNRINEYNAKLVLQKSYAVSPLLFATMDKGITLLAIGGKLYLANMRGDSLLVRELDMGN